MCETIEQDLEYITESSDGVKKYTIEGIFAQSESKNRNGRIYPKNVMENSVNKYIKDQVNEKRSVGELNHPATPTINLDKVSHLITELKWAGNDVVGRASILDTPMGNIAKGLLDGGVRLGVSTRGMGSLEERNGSMYVGKDYFLSTVDIVQDPSAPSAFVNGIMEGVEYYFDENHQLLMQKSEELRDTVRKMPTKRIAECQTKMFKDFLNSL
jgi:hypothetical protein